MNGKPVKEAGFETHAVFGHAAARECAVLGSQRDAHCGSATELQLMPAGPLAAYRTFLGSERVHAHVRGRPTGLPSVDIQEPHAVARFYYSDNVCCLCMA